MYDDNESDLHKISSNIHSLSKTLHEVKTLIKDKEEKLLTALRYLGVKSS